MSETRSSSKFDSQKAETFAGRLLNALNSGGFCLMASIGHRTGLFDAMREQPPMTSGEIATRAGLNERYVREWLGAMVTAGVVDVDPPSLTFSLPPEHAAFLTRAAAADNMAVFTQYIALLGCVEEAIVECFKNGGGVPYEQFPRFHEVMAEDSGQSVLSSLESHILPLVPGLAEPLLRQYGLSGPLAVVPEGAVCLLGSRAVVESHDLQCCKFCPRAFPLQPMVRIDSTPIMGVPL